MLFPWCYGSRIFLDFSASEARLAELGHHAPAYRPRGPQRAHLRTIVHRGQGVDVRGRPRLPPCTRVGHGRLRTNRGLPPDL